VDRLAIIATESRRLADALAGVAPGRGCPTCPEWTAADLLWHLTEVHFFWAGILARRITSDTELPVVERSKPARPASFDELFPLRERATDALLEQLESREDAEPCWSWWPADQTVGFTRRMQTYEATMHRIDAELTASSTVGPVADDVSAGAVDHAVDVMWGWMPAGAVHRPEGLVELIATDSGARWLVEVGAWTAPAGESGPRALRADAGRSTATVAAPLADLALWAWTRGGAVRTDGDLATLGALDAVIAEGLP
jgi:uncharacterized protein (TIGR03083 family)